MSWMGQFTSDGQAARHIHLIHTLDSSTSILSSLSLFASWLSVATNCSSEHIHTDTRIHTFRLSATCSRTGRIRHPHHIHTYALFLSGLYVSTRGLSEHVGANWRIHAHARAYMLTRIHALGFLVTCCRTMFSSEHTHARAHTHTHTHTHTHHKRIHALCLVKACFPHAVYLGLQAAAIGADTCHEQYPDQRSQNKGTIPWPAGSALSCWAAGLVLHETRQSQLESLYERSASFEWRDLSVQVSYETDWDSV